MNKKNTNKTASAAVLLTLLLQSQTVLDNNGTPDPVVTAFHDSIVDLEPKQDLKNEKLT